MLSLQLSLDQSIAQKVLDFLQQFPEEDLKIDAISLDEAEIKQKLQQAEMDISAGKVHTSEVVRSLLVS